MLDSKVSRSVPPPASLSLSMSIFIFEEEGVGGGRSRASCSASRWYKGYGVGRSLVGQCVRVCREGLEEIEALSAKVADRLEAASGVVSLSGPWVVAKALGRCAGFDAKGSALADISFEENGLRVEVFGRELALNMLSPKPIAEGF